MFNLWIVGDEALSGLENEFKTVRHAGEKDDEVIPLYMNEYFNVKIFVQSKTSAEFASTRIINALIQVTNGKNARLPKYLIVMPDKNILEDFSDPENLKTKTLQMSVDWFVRQINSTIKRKKLDLYDKKPGAVSGTTQILFVHMLRSYGTFKESKLSQILDLRPRSNDALNDAVAKVDQRILTINSCNTYEHFNSKANLSLKGKTEFWCELDDLVARFHRNKIKLLPNPKNPPRSTPKNNNKCEEENKQRLHENPTSWNLSNSNNHHMNVRFHDYNHSYYDDYYQPFPSQSFTSEQPAYTDYRWKLPSPPPYYKH